MIMKLRYLQMLLVFTLAVIAVFINNDTFTLAVTIIIGLYGIFDIILYLWDLIGCAKASEEG